MIPTVQNGDEKRNQNLRQQNYSLRKKFPRNSCEKRYQQMGRGGSLRLDTLDVVVRENGRPKTT